jgi:hypothetical protein
MIDIRNAQDPVSTLEQILAVPAPRVIVLGDARLAEQFDHFIRGDQLEEVVLAPGTARVLGILTARGGERIADDARAAAINATSGQVADVIQRDEAVDNVRMMLAFAKAES